MLVVTINRYMGEVYHFILMETDMRGNGFTAKLMAMAHLHTQMGMCMRVRYVKKIVLLANVLVSGKKERCTGKGFMFTVMGTDMKVNG